MNRFFNDIKKHYYNVFYDRIHKFYVIHNNKYYMKLNIFTNAFYKLRDNEFIVDNNNIIQYNDDYYILKSHARQLINENKHELFKYVCDKSENTWKPKYV